MFSACTKCYSNFTTVRGLKHHQRRYHPNTMEGQIICKICNMRLSDQYFLNRHNMKYHNGTVSTMGTPRTETYQNRDSGNAQSVKEDYTEKLRNLEIIQQRNTDLIRGNTMNLAKILEITEALARRIGVNKEYQAEEIKNKTFSCEICNKIYKNSANLTRHRSRFHRVKSTIDLNCYKCKELFPSERDLAVHNYRFHRVSL